MSNMEKAQKMRKEFDEPDVFGGKITFRQLWWIIKLVKIVRKYARSNSALYNLFNELFNSVATFKEVTKTKDDGTAYPGLEITMKMYDGSMMTQSEKGGEEE